MRVLHHTAEVELADAEFVCECFRKKTFSANSGEPAWRFAGKHGFGIVAFTEVGRYMQTDSVEPVEVVSLFVEITFEFVAFIPRADHCVAAEFDACLRCGHERGHHRECENKRY